MKSAIVVGAGLAGLSAALELSRRGIEVTVFESADRAGGRARELRSADGAYRFDMGPTIITMPDVLRSALGEPAYSSLHLERLDPGYSVFWPDDRFDMRSDIAEWLAEVARLGCKSNAGALKYIADVHEQYVESRAKILDVDHNIGSAVSLLLRPGRLRPWVFGNLRRFAEHHFNAGRVVEAMTFQTLYLGLSPARAQAIYALLGVQEIVGGVWFARGGTSAIVDAFVSECRRNGVVFRFGLPVRLVPVGRNRASGVIAGGALHEADSIVIAADREPALRNLLVDSMRREVRYGHSAVVYYLGIRGSVDIPHHAVFLPDDPWKAYDALDDGRLPDEALFYACNPARSVGNGDRSSLMLLAPVPNRAALRAIDYEALLQRLLLRLRTHNVDVAHRIEFRAVRGPEHFESELGLQYGAAFGPAHDLAQMGPLRPSIRYRGARNVAFAGSGTHPGSGVPMVITSGRLAAKHLLEGVR